MTRKVLIFTGAPLGDSLDWDSPGLLREFNDPIASFAGLPTTTSHTKTPSSGPEYSVWRSLPLKRRHIPTGFSQQHNHLLADTFSENADFFTTADVSFGGPGSFISEKQLQQQELSEEGSRLLSQFCERSLLVHDEIPSSQLDAISFRSSQGETTASSLMTNETTSFTSTQSGSGRTTRSGGASFALEPAPPPSGIIVPHLSDLEDIPNATYLTSIEPQTMTVNLIVGIISIAAPRTVKTRWGATRSLVEVLVGDETRSGFGVTFWLGPADDGAGPLAGLRPQDVVLLRNVALGSFMKKVYGHALRRGLTKVQLLHRRRLGADDVGGVYTTADLVDGGGGGGSKRVAIHVHPQVLKTRRVREWVIRFVGNGTVPSRPSSPPGRKRKRGQADLRRWDLPPPDDTQ